MSEDGKEPTVVSDKALDADTGEKGRIRTINGVAMKQAMKCMISFFTIFRLDVNESDMRSMEENFWMAPLLGFIKGLLVFAVCMVLALCNVNILVTAVAALATVYIFSKFLHFDGLTDFGDGMIVSSGRREDHIRALKDSLIGAGGFGVALTVVLLTVSMYYSVGNDLFAGTDKQLYSVGIAFFALALEVLVKNAQVAAATFGEPGNGMASRQVGCTDMRSLVMSSVLTCILLGVTALVSYAVWNCFGNHFGGFSTAVSAVLFIVSVLMSVVVGYLMARVANKTFGFVNGDILGATNEISRAVVLLAALLIIGL